MAPIVAVMIGWSMLLLAIAGVQARKIHDDPNRYWKDQNKEEEDEDDDDNDKDSD